MNRNPFDPTAPIIAAFAIYWTFWQIALGMNAPSVPRDQLGKLGR
jgi:hypothetical protein